MQFTDLPPEVVTNIFRQLHPIHLKASELRQSHANKINIIQAIARVNKKYHELAIPILYSSIILDYREERTQALVRTLEAIPIRHTHIRHLALRFGAVVQPDIALKVLKRCKNLRSLYLDGHLEEEFHALYIEAIMSRKMSQLYLERECAAPILRHMLISGGPADLKALRMSDCYGTDPASLLPSFTRHADIEELSIDAAFWPTSTITTLICWPNRLRVFKCNISKSSWTSRKRQGRFNQAALQLSLDTHAKTLESIKIVGWSDSTCSCDTLDDSMLRLSAYTNLKHAQLHERNVFDMDPERISSGLPPGLVSIAIDLKVSGDYQEDNGGCDVSYHRLDQEGTIWLENFFDIRRERMAGHKLKNVHIKYHFFDSDIPHCSLTAYIYDEPWPLQSIEDTASALIRFGVLVTYPKPCLSKDMWHLMIKDQTVPGWEYETTKAERLAVIPATHEELVYHLNVYKHYPEGE